MSFQVENNEHFVMLKSTVEKLDSSVSPDLKAEIVFQNGKGEKNIVIDLSDVKYIDSSGLSAILVANRLCKGCQGVLVLTGVNDSVMKLITISQLDTILNIIQNPNEIIDFIIMDNIENDLTGE
ncbi:MAG: STAS domain-containing protein [Candidatus Competibacteraceae bacterium]|nr:STAS domain-containing protein [Candidatus Competibacteraceae bacterium]